MTTSQQPIISSSDGFSIANQMVSYITNEKYQVLTMDQAFKSIKKQHTIINRIYAISSVTLVALAGYAYTRFNPYYVSRGVLLLSLVVVGSYGLIKMGLNKRYTTLTKFFGDSDQFLQDAWETKSTTICQYFDQNSTSQQIITTQRGEAFVKTISEGFDCEPLSINLQVDRFTTGGEEEALSPEQFEAIRKREKLSQHSKNLRDKIQVDKFDRKAFSDISKLDPDFRNCLLMSHQKMVQFAFGEFSDPVDPNIPYVEVWSGDTRFFAKKWS